MRMLFDWSNFLSCLIDPSQWSPDLQRCIWWLRSMSSIVFHQVRCALSALIWSLGFHIESWIDFWWYLQIHHYIRQILSRPWNSICVLWALRTISCGCHLQLRRPGSEVAQGHLPNIFDTPPTRSSWRWRSTLCKTFWSWWFHPFLLLEALALMAANLWWLLVRRIYFCLTALNYLGWSWENSNLWDLKLENQLWIHQELEIQNLISNLGSTWVLHCASHEKHLRQPSIVAFSGCKWTEIFQSSLCAPVDKVRAWP